MKLSENFDSKEFECPCCGKVKIDENFLFILQLFRDRIGKPIYITKGGGFRCNKYNKKIKGAKLSEHLKGKAVDFYVKNLSMKIIHKQLEGEFVFILSGVGIDKQRKFFHIDSGKRYARWLYIDGKPYYFF